MININKIVLKDYNECLSYLLNFKENIDSVDTIIAFDIETKNLNLYKNNLLGFGFAYSDKEGAYFVTRNFSKEEVRHLLKLINSFKSKIVLHNAYFDISQINYMFNMKFKWTYDTYIFAHALHSNVLLYAESKDKSNSLSLKELCKTYYPEIYGYEEELNKIKNSICKKEHIPIRKFEYDLFDDDTLAPYGVYDVVATYRLFISLKQEVKEALNSGWNIKELLQLKHEATKIYIEAKVNGIRINRDTILELNSEWDVIVKEKKESILNNESIKKVESILLRLKIQKEMEKKELKIKNKKEVEKDIEKLNKYIDKTQYITQKQLDKLSLESKFNLNSPIQKKILFLEILKLEPLKFNKADAKGNKSPKLDKEFLDYYKHIPLVNDFLEYSLYNKGVTSFLGVGSEDSEGLWNLTFEEYPLNHPNSNLQGTITHRIAQNSVNFQQLPSRGKLSELKKCVIPRHDNHRIVAFDYSSAELYILGALSQEPKFIYAINNGLDLHSSMAYNIWGDKLIIDDNIIEKEELDPEFNGKSLRDLNNNGVDIIKILNILKNYFPSYRFDAKAVGFGLPYGIGVKGLANNIGKTTFEASKVLEEYMEYNQKIKEFMDFNKDFLCANGYIEGKHSQRLYMGNAKGYDWRTPKDYNSKNWEAIKELRKSTNYIIQSENAMVLYKSLVTFFKEVKKLKLDKKILLMTTIYDAVYLSVDISISDDYIENLLKKHFEIEYFNGVTFKIDISKGNNMKEV